MGFRVSDDAGERYFDGKNEGDAAILDIQFGLDADVSAEPCVAGIPGVDVQRTPQGVRLVISYGREDVNHVECSFAPADG